MAEIINRKKRIHHEIPKNEGLNITPLIDVVFQLLIFFMVASSLVKPNQIELDLPESTSGTKAAEQQTIVVTYRITDGAAQITLNTDPIADVGELSDALRGIQTPADAQRPQVDVRIDKAVPYQNVIAVIDAIRDAGYPRFRLPVLMPGS